MCQNSEAKLCRHAYPPHVSIGERHPELPLIYCDPSSTPPRPQPAPAPNVDVWLVYIDMSMHRRFGQNSEAKLCRHAYPPHVSIGERHPELPLLYCDPSSTPLALNLPLPHMAMYGWCISTCRCIDDCVKIARRSFADMHTLLMSQSASGIPNCR